MTGAKSKQQSGSISATTKSIEARASNSPLWCAAFYLAHLNICGSAFGKVIHRVYVQLYSIYLSSVLLYFIYFSPVQLYFILKSMVSGDTVCGQGRVCPPCGYSDQKANRPAGESQ